MDAYAIIMTPDAENDLAELRDYIAEDLQAPDTARSYLRAIRREVATLSELPGRIRPMDEEPWHSRGIRRMMVKNFFVYYRIDQEAGLIYVLNVIYARRDQLRALTE